MSQASLISTSSFALGDSMSPIADRGVINDFGEKMLKVTIVKNIKAASKTYRYTSVDMSGPFVPVIYSIARKIDRIMMNRLAVYSTYKHFIQGTVIVLETQSSHFKSR